MRQYLFVEKKRGGEKKKRKSAAFLSTLATLKATRWRFVGRAAAKPLSLTNNASHVSSHHLTIVSLTFASRPLRRAPLNLERQAEISTISKLSSVRVKLLVGQLVLEFACRRRAS